ncbi:MAG: ABC transporter permease [Verrucomicrobia bacterium]|nr:ABC transporter permease [Verrucomicrobiota bacterium]MBI3869718.1 ABC transporter permease [Verrucomicrobiota bacterium]
MKKVIGIFCLLLVVCVATAMMSDQFLTKYNIENLLRRTGLFGILSVGVAFVIITSGIDLSIGSVVCLVGVGLPWMLTVLKVPLGLALLTVFGVSLGIGWAHGLLVTKLRIQPFVVTLCGLLIYRGLARGITRDQTMGFGNDFKALRWLATEKISAPGIEGFGVPLPFILMIGVAILAAILLNQTVHGRYLLALGRNEDAARYSGINTHRMIIMAYVICAAMAGFGGMLFVLDVNSAQPADFGNFYELYAIAAAVLGGCSLRGGQGTILGVILGTALMQVLRTMITLVDALPKNIEYAIIGAVILGGVATDELVKRYVAQRKAAKQLQA